MRQICFPGILVDERRFTNEGQRANEAIDSEQIKAFTLLLVLHSHGVGSVLLPRLHQHFLFFCVVNTTQSKKSRGNEGTILQTFPLRLPADNKCQQSCPRNQVKKEPAYIWLVTLPAGKKKERNTPELILGVASPPAFKQIIQLGAWCC